MSDIKSNQDPTIRFAKLFAMMYYHMCDQLCKCLGEEEGKAAIARAVRAFGEERSEAMHREAAERGIVVVDDPSYHLIRDMPGIGWIKGEKGVVECPFASVWAGYGEAGKEYGQLYCAIDEQLFDSFGLILEREHILTRTGDYCEFPLRKK